MIKTNTYVQYVMVGNYVSIIKTSLIAYIVQTRNIYVHIINSEDFALSVQVI